MWFIVSTTLDILLSIMNIHGEVLPKSNDANHHLKGNKELKVITLWDSTFQIYVLPGFIDIILGSLETHKTPTCDIS